MPHASFLTLFVCDFILTLRFTINVFAKELSGISVISLCIM